LQGITLPPLIRALGLAGAAGPNCEEQEARRIVIEAAVSHLDESKVRDDKASSGVYEDLASHYRHRLASLKSCDEGGEETPDHDRYIHLSLETLRIERETAIRLRNEGRINDEVLRRIERELDLTESRLSIAD
jgi:CPA1 family monovalent cation:H+ antiporter